MGPNIKFVSAITDAFSNKKMGVNFFRKKDQTGGGGSEGGLVKDHTFPAFFFCTLPLYILILEAFARISSSIFCNFQHDE